MKPGGVECLICHESLSIGLHDHENDSKPIPKWTVKPGDLPSYPFKATNGSICSDFKTAEQAIQYCKEQNQ